VVLICPQTEPVRTAAGSEVVSDGEIEARIVKGKDGTVSFSFGGLVDMMKNIGRGGDPPQARGGSQPHPLVARPVGRAISGKRMPEALPRRGSRAFAEAGGTRETSRRSFHESKRLAYSGNPLLSLNYPTCL
jgi:hypothetical protein